MRVFAVIAGIAATVAAAAVKKDIDVCGWGTSQAWGCAFRIKAPVNSYNGLYLTIRDNGTLYLNNEDARLGSSRTDPTFFFAGLYDRTGTFKLLPDIQTVASPPQKRDIIDSLQIGLQLRTPGFLTLINYLQPNYLDAEAMGAAPPSSDRPVEWAVFTVDPKTGKLWVDDGTHLPTRTWAAYTDADGQFYFGMWDGITKLPYPPTNITITAFERYRHWDAYRGWVDDGLYPLANQYKGPMGHDRRSPVS